MRESKIFSVPILILVVVLGLWTEQLGSLYNRIISLLQPDSVPPVFSCQTPPMKVRFMSYDPVLVHIENFLSDAEISHLKQIAHPLYSSSTIGGNGTSIVDSKIRSSKSARLPVQDLVTQCIQRRAAEFQGFTSLENVEQLQAVKYGPGQAYNAHYDWFGESVGRDRVTTFFAILEANCTGGGTDFPLVQRVPWETRPEWCDLVVCEDFDGIVVKPRVGSALFWVNLYKNGTGNEETLHAGHSVVEGTKIGLNIWTRRDAR